MVYPIYYYFEDSYHIFCIATNQELAETIMRKLNTRIHRAQKIKCGCQKLYDKLLSDFSLRFPGKDFDDTPIEELSDLYKIPVKILNKIFNIIDCYIPEKFYVDEPVKFYKDGEIKFNDLDSNELWKYLEENDND